jgi:hypothetical protein
MAKRLLKALLISQDTALAKTLGRALKPLGLTVLKSSPPLGARGKTSWGSELKGDNSLLIVDGRDYLAGFIGTPEANGQGFPTLLLLKEEMLSAIREPLHADEVIVMPLRPGEVRLRVGQLLGERAYGRRPGPSPSPEGPGDLSLDADRYEIALDGTPLELTYLEFELLKYLMTHPERTLTREHLLNQVWGKDYLGGTRTVDVHIRRLRAKLERGNRDFVKTVRGVGYQFLA